MFRILILKETCLFPSDLLFCGKKLMFQPLFLVLMRIFEWMDEILQTMLKMISFRAYISLFLQAYNNGVILKIITICENFKLIAGEIKFLSLNTFFR